MGCVPADQGRHCSSGLLQGRGPGWTVCPSACPPPACPACSAACLPAATAVPASRFPAPAVPAAQAAVQAASPCCSQPCWPAVLPAASAAFCCFPDRLLVTIQILCPGLKDLNQNLFMQNKYPQTRKKKKKKKKKKKYSALIPLFPC